MEKRLPEESLWNGVQSGDRTHNLSLRRGALYPLSYPDGTGGSRETRTLDLRIKSPLLYRLSYASKKVVPLIGLEPIRCWASDFESDVSTNFTTAAFVGSVDKYSVFFIECKRFMSQRSRSVFF